MNRLITLFIAIAMMALLLPSSATAQFKENVAAASFDRGIGDFSWNNLPDLAQAMVENTRLEVLVKRAEKVVLVAGVVDTATGEILYGSVSDPILAIPNKFSLIEIGAGRLVTPWQGFDDPLLGFDDPLLGFDDPLLGFDDPLLGFDDPLLGFENPDFVFADRSFGFETVGDALDAIWGTNGASYQPMRSSSFRWGVGSRAAETPADVLDAIWGTNGASYEGPGDTLLVVAPLSLNPDTRVSYSAAILPFNSEVRD